MKTLFILALTIFSSAANAADADLIQVCNSRAYPSTYKMCIESDVSAAQAIACGSYTIAPSSFKGCLEITKAKNLSVESIKNCGENTFKQASYFLCLNQSH